MQILDMRLAVDDHVSPESVLRLIAVSHQHVYGGALLKPNGFGHLILDGETMTVLVDDNIEPGQSIRERIQSP